MLPHNSVVFSGLVKSVGALREGGGTPSEITKSILARWVQQSYPDLALEGAPPPYFLEAPVIKFGEWLSESDLIIGAFWLSSAYAALLPKEKRKSSSMYFTPPRLTGRLLDCVEARIAIESGPLIDPACGGGAFLAPAAIRIVEKLEAKGLRSEAILSHLEANVFGCETDEFLCWLSAAFLRMAVAKTIKDAGREPTFTILQGDGLKLFEAREQGFQVVLCNPPYRKMTQTELEPYLNSYSDVVKGQPNLYSLFIRRTTQLLSPGGVGAVLTPMSFLSGQSFAPLRKMLIERGKVEQLDLIHDKDGIFLSAEQDTVITTWRNRTATASEKATQVFCLESQGKFDFAGTLHLSTEPTPWPVPRHASDKELSLLFDGTKTTLDNYGYHARTGALVYHRDKRPRFLSSEQAINPKALMPLIWSKNISPDGEFSLNRVSSPSKERFVDMGEANAAGAIRKPAVVLQRVSSTEQPRRLVGAAVPAELFTEFGGVVGENHVCFLEQADSECEISPELLAQILRTTTVDRVFRCISGATNVSAYELKHLPLPAPKKLLTAMAQGLDIEAAVRHAYGLPIQKHA
ncbi:Eco57I restriction-modification methylase domain-containing protein [Fluviibacter phosphoraccumulans]|uniref:site-specific DNA-methyltransferase (adenine-specific) n=1 Tax=Fluviibacter phosphoraccumulans TaxID=1751046 RepID=A0A7R6R426_9RHOO|nr:class I SAM-dependent methyltransferase [Fluviibacter phosphoraccumulans]BBU68744.1 RNA methyltransferase [Fluviibacter phosphoraccumulans]BBU72103.1 RNA methyltransferase [Fluviibacter phosphoraccumulans]